MDTKNNESFDMEYDAKDNMCLSICVDKPRKRGRKPKYENDEERRAAKREQERALRIGRKNGTIPKAKPRNIILTEEEKRAHRTDANRKWHEKNKEYHVRYISEYTKRVFKHSKILKELIVMIHNKIPHDDIINFYNKSTAVQICNESKSPGIKDCAMTNV